MKQTNVNDNFWLKLALVVSGMAAMIDLAIYPAADAIYTVFAEENIALVNFIITGPSLMIVIGSILCGFVTQKIGKKQILSIAYLFFCISAIFGGTFDNVYYMIVMRTIAGLSAGFISICSAGLIVELFVDEQIMSRIMGTYTGMMSLFGAIMSLAAGYVAVIDWHLVFMIYLIAVPILILIILFVPKTKPENTQEEITQESEEKVQWIRPLSLAGAAFVLNAAYAVVLTMIAVFLAEQGIGDAATAGTMGMLGTLGSMIACFLFSKTYMVLKRRTPIIFSLVMALGFIILANTVSVTGVSIAVFCMGAMYGMGYSYYLMYASMVVPQSKSSLSISITNAAVYLGLFFGPYVCPLYESLFHVDTMATCMPYLAVTCFLYTILSIAINVINTKK